MNDVTLTCQPTPNLPLLRKVLDHIDAEPATWNQASWGWESLAAEWVRDHPLEPRAAWPAWVDRRFIRGATCGTARCVAGWAVTLDEDAWRRLAADPGGQVSEVARVALGLTRAEAQDLFLHTLDASNVRAAVQAVAERVAARAGERL